VGYVADRIAVMNRGRVVEIGSAGDVMDAPEHPYTRSLLASIPELPADAWAEGSPRPGGTYRR
jgi:peptide/nickel transport system ATP-binding protein